MTAAAASTRHEAGDLVTLLGQLFQQSSDRAHLRYAATLPGGLRASHFAAHVDGRARIGAIPFVTDTEVRWACIDLDVKHWGLEPDDPEVFAMINATLEELALLGLRGALERSRSKGWHVWTFFAEPVPAVSVRRVFLSLLRRSGVPEEGLGADDLVCPRTDDATNVGNGTYLPLSGQSESPFTRFYELDPDSEDWLPADDQAAYLRELIEYPSPVAGLIAAAATIGDPDAQSTNHSEEGAPCAWIFDELAEHGIELRGAIVDKRGEKIQAECPLHVAAKTRRRGGSLVIWSDGHGHCSSTRCDRKWRTLREFVQLMESTTGEDAAGDPAGSTERPEPRFRIVSAVDMKPRLTDRGLVKGLLDVAAFVVVYGASNSSKTFLVLHLAACVATGRDFFGRRVRRGLVVYVACEGGASIANRIEGLNRHGSADLGALHVLPAPVDLLDRTGDVDALVDAIRDVEAEAGERCALVIVDTLSQAMAGGNENGHEDMSTAVASANRLRAELACAFALVHHSGKDEVRGARGHSSLRAATDTEIEVTTADEGLFQFRATKQRDREIGPALAYRLEVVELGHDEDDELVTTCVVAPAEAGEIARPKRRGKLSARGQIVSRCIEDLLAADRGVPVPDGPEGPPRRAVSAGQFGVRRDELREQFIARCGDAPDSRDNGRDTLRKAFARVLEAMQAADRIGVFDGVVWFTD